VKTEKMHFQVYREALLYSLQTTEVTNVNFCTKKIMTLMSLLR